MAFFFQDFFGGGNDHLGHEDVYYDEDEEGGEEQEQEQEQEDDDDEDGNSDSTDTNKLYTLLGIVKSSDENEIKNAYKKKARELHPDRHPEEREKYHMMFQELQHAYDILKDPEKRKIYDKYGEKGLKRGGGGPSDLFSFFSQQREEESGPKKSPSIKQILDVTLEDLYKGTMKEVEIERYTANSRNAKCGHCNGRGATTVVQRMGPMMVRQQHECPKCEGQGYKLDSNMVKIQVHIPVGAKTGELVTVRGEGHSYPDHAPGDVVFQLRTLKHETFTRQGADLGMNATLSLREALCGYELRIKHVSGHILIVTPSKEKHEVVQPGSLKRVYTQGMPQRFSPHVKGHLYIVMDVRLPLAGSLSTKQIRQLKTILPDQIIEQAEENKEDHEEGDEDGEEKKSPNKKPDTNNNNNSNNNKNNNNNNNKNTNNKTKTPTSGGNKKKKKNNKKNKKNKEANKKKKNEEKEKEVKAEEVEEETEDIIEEVECHEVDGTPHYTPAAAKGLHDEDEEDEREGVPCQQM